MKRRPIVALVALISTGIASLASIASGTQSKEANRMELSYDLKLDEASAVKIAEVIFVKVYGERVLAERPWKVKLEKDDSIFFIEGTFNAPKGARGGVGEIRIKRSNAEVVSILHGK